MGRLRAWPIRLAVSGEDGLPSGKAMRSYLAGQRLSAWRSTISQRRVTMTIISSWDVKKDSAKLQRFGLSFEFAGLDGSARCMAFGGNSIAMGLSMSQHCSLTTSERFLESRSGRRHSHALQIPRPSHEAPGKRQRRAFIEFCAQSIEPEIRRTRHGVHHSSQRSDA